MCELGLKTHPVSFEPYPSYMFNSEPFYDRSPPAPPPLPLPLAGLLQ